MQREMLKSKIHRVTVTEAELYYEGSITVDKDLLQAADILPYEKVQVLNFNNGSRLDTYAIEGTCRKWNYLPEWSGSTIWFCW